MVMFEQWVQNLRKVKKRFPKFFKQNKRLYCNQIVKGFDLGIKVNRNRLLYGNEKSYSAEIRRIKRTIGRQRLEKKCGFKLQISVEVSIGQMGQLGRMRNLLLGLFLRRH